MNFAQTNVVLSPTEQSSIDVLRTALMMNIAAISLKGILNSELPLPAGMNANVLKQTVDTMDRFTRESKRTIGKTKSYLDRLPGEEFAQNMETIGTMLFRIGIEQSEDQYEEFFGMLIDMIDIVFYAQNHRRNMNFSKYRKLCELIINEIKADVNRTPNQIQYFQSELFFRCSSPVHEPKIK